MAREHELAEVAVYAEPRIAMNGYARSSGDGVILYGCGVVGEW